MAAQGLRQPAAAAAAAMAGAGGEFWVGPQGDDEGTSNWQSVRLELRPGGRFELELWRFHESFCYHGSDAAAGSARLEEAEGRRQPTHHVSEVRAKLAGRCRSSAAAGVRLVGLTRRELNQAYVEDEAWPVGGQATWWSADGRFFLFFDASQQHWKVNGTRAAGGDGLCGVGGGCRRAGRGWAHSGVAGAGCEPRASLRGGGWFELEEDEWAPVQVEVEDCSDVLALEFVACQVQHEEHHRAGEEKAEERHNAEEALVFRGWRRERSADLRLALPALPRAAGEEDGEAESMPVLGGGGGGDESPAHGARTWLGDPDSVVLMRAARL